MRYPTAAEAAAIGSLMLAAAGITDGQLVRGEKTQVRAAAFEKASEAGQLAEGLKLCQEIVRELALECGK